MKTILIIEDRLDIQRGYYWALEEQIKKGQIQLLQASTIERVEETLAAHRNQNSSLSGIDIIVMDACLCGNKPDTLILTQSLRTNYHFQGPIIAISSIEEYRQLLINAGASHQCSKVEFPKFVQQFLKE